MRKAFSIAFGKLKLLMVLVLLCLVFVTKSFGGERPSVEVSAEVFAWVSVPFYEVGEHFFEAIELKRVSSEEREYTVRYRSVFDGRDSGGDYVEKVVGLPRWIGDGYKALLYRQDDEHIVYDVGEEIGVVDTKNECFSSSAVSWCEPSILMRDDVDWETLVYVGAIQQKRDDFVFFESVRD